MAPFAADQEAGLMYLDLVYFLVPLFAFAALIELFHFLPYMKGVTEKVFFERAYPAAVVLLASMLVFELSFAAELFLGSEVLHRLLEILSMAIILYETELEVRGSSEELQRMSATKEVLERSEKRYRQLIETMNDGFWAIDGKGVTTMVNDKLAEMLGYPVKEITGRNVMSFVDERSQGRLKKELEKRSRGAASRYELELTRKDGSKLPVLVSASPLFDEAGRFLGSFAVITDISRQKEMERRIRDQARDLEATVEERTKDLSLAKDSLMNMLEDLTLSKKELELAYEELKGIERIKTDIISNVSHEFRTPVTIAKSAIDLIREEEDPEEREHLLAMCENALTRLNELVDNLVDVADVYRGRYVLEKRKVDINRVIRQSMDNLRFRALEKNVTLSYTADGDLPEVIGDERSLRQILYNLIDNAIKFNRKGGRVEITAAKKEGSIEISVKDTGIGIQPEYTEKIFEPLFQIEATTTRRYGGTGIGLAVVKNLVAAHRGRVWVESTPGKGSTFRFTLPLEGEKDL
ncbi:MAG: PAS domain S-box protein [Methanobacteriota archaeon]|nr:MAG: PAS domain S-box protein [Euryarchaeota archaeon]